jgi:hypothetical protein
VSGHRTEEKNERNEIVARGKAPETAAEDALETAPGLRAKLLASPFCLFDRFF